MFVSDELIFLQLQKTASTHTAAQLQRHLGGRVSSKHAPLEIDPEGRLVVGSVRNPWDWYVSLWAYGCSGQGGVQGMLKSSHVGSALRIVGSTWRRPSAWGGALRDLEAHAGRDLEFWRVVYANPYDPKLFRRWLTAVLSERGRRLLGHDYASRPLSGFTGLYTYRFLSAFTPASDWRAHADKIRATSDIGPFFDRYSAVEMLIRNERLEEDLAEVFARIGHPLVTAAVLRGNRTNVSRRGKAVTYYDAASRKLVAESDAFIVGHFGYAFPGEPA